MRKGTITKYLQNIVFFISGGAAALYLYNRLSSQNNYNGYQKRLFEQCAKENELHNINLDGYFTRNGYKKIVIYGLGVYYHEFLDNIIPENYENILLSDKGAASMSSSGHYEIILPHELLNNDIYDVIVVTSLNHGTEIVNELRQAGIQKPIITYHELVLNAAKERNML